MRTLLLVLLFSGTIFGQQQMANNAQIKKCTLTWTGYGAVGNYALTGDLRMKDGYFAKNPEGSLDQGYIAFDMGSINHENATLVRHLKSEDFFYVESFPEASFRITKITPSTLIGELTIRGNTHDMQVPYTQKQVGGQVNLQGTVRVDRTQYDIRYNSSSFFKNLGDQAIKDYFDLAFELVLE